MKQEISIELSSESIKKLNKISEDNNVTIDSLIQFSIDKTIGIIEIEEFLKGAE